MLTQVLKKATHKLHKDDQVVITGVYVGHNYRNNKCIIQLIKPDFSQLPNATAMTDQYIEIDAKYVKQTPKRETKEALIVPSHTDNVSMDQEAKYSENKKEETSNDIVSDFKTNIKKEWDNIIDKKDAASMQIDSEQTCDAWTLKDCDSCKRVLLCLSYYRSWIIHKQQTRDNNSIQNTNDKHIYVEYLTNFIQSLPHYSSVQMLNDFHHIKQFHISIDNKDKHNVFEFFKRNMGICNSANCRSYSRHQNRCRSECKQSDKLRRQFYFIDESQIKSMQLSHNDEISEVNIQQLFDMIHCALSHHQSLMIGQLSKFVTQIKQKDEKQAEEKDSNGLILRKDLTPYDFGVQFKYHSAFKSSRNYVKRKYKSLKAEILNNQLYTISEFDFDAISSQCQQYLQCYRGRLLLAKRKYGLNDICKINPNTPIAMGHVITIMLYTNMTLLQRAFKKGCLYLTTETFKNVKKSNREIANWCRLLWEAITFFGKSITKSEVFYHGLDCKLLFDSVIGAFNSPTSTSVNKSIALNFSTKNGIIVQLSKSLDSSALDVSYISDFPHEEERLFFQAQLRFVDIVYRNISHKYFIKCLNLFQHITKAMFFTHNTKIFNKQHQNTLIKMMDSMVNHIQNKNIPSYMQQLFEYYCKSIKYSGNIIWINKDEFHKLDENIRAYLLDKRDDNFMAWLKRSYNIQVKYPKIVSYTIQNDQNANNLDFFWEGQSVALPVVFYTHTNKKNKKNKKNKIMIKFKMKISGTYNSSIVMIMCKITNNHVPDDIKKLKCDLDIFCPQIQFSHSSAITISSKLQGIPLCKPLELDGLNAFEWKICVKFRCRVDSGNFVYKV